MPAEIPIPWLSYYSLGSLVYDIIAQVFGLPDPMSLFLSLFDGRPTMQATADIAGTLNKYTTPSIKFLALGACDLIRHDIPISSPQAASIFGPYFRAALDIECGIRWSRRDPSVEAVEDQTLTAALHEAGNPGVAGTATLHALQTVYLQFQEGHYLSGISPVNYFTSMAQEAGSDPATLMEKGWANSYIGNIVQPPPPPPPGPGPAPEISVDIHQNQVLTGEVSLLGYAKSDIKNLVWLVDFHQILSGFSGQWNSTTVADGAHTLTVSGQNAAGHVVAQLTLTFNTLNHGHPSGSANVKFNFSYGQTVKGTFPIAVTVQGGPFPQAHVTITANGNQLATIPDGTQNAAQPETYVHQWNTTTVPNGLYAITAQWIGHLGTVHGQFTSELVVDNGTQPQPKPPPPILEIPFENWFKVCSEVPQCQHISNDYLALAQAVSNIAYAVYNLPKLWAAQPPDPCCDRVIQALASMAQELTTALHNMAALPNAAVLEPPLRAAAEALAGINKALGGVGPDFTGLEKTLETSLKPLVEIAAKMDTADLKCICDQLKMLVEDQHLSEAWKKALLESGALPAELSGLVQGTGAEEAIAAIEAANTWLYNLIHKYDWPEIPRIYDHIVKPLLISLWQVLKLEVPKIAREWVPVGKEVATLAKFLSEGLDLIITTLFGFAANGAVEWYEHGLEGIDTTTEAGTKAATKLLLGRALEMGQAAHLLATLPEIAYLTKSLGLHEMAAFIAEMAGFREVLINTHRPLLSTKLGRPATYVFNRKFPTALPPAPAAFGWWARRLLSDADVKHVAASAGYADHWDATMHRAAYRPISPRALTTLMQDQPFDKVRMREILQDNSYSDAHVDFMLDELDYASTKNVRNSYVSEALTAYKAGVMPDHELNDILDSLGWSTEAKKFVHDRAALARRVTLADKVEKSVVPLVAQGLLSPEVGLQHMEAAGIQEWYARLEITLATTKAELTAARKEATEELRAEHARQRNLTRAAVAEYHAGRVNTAELSVALHAIGLDNTLVASVVALEEALRAGRVKLTYGQLLAPEASAVLKQQVAALEQQFKDNMLPLHSVYNQLAALKVPPAESHALVARWAASLKKTPGAALLVDPITGQLETHVAG